MCSMNYNHIFHAGNFADIVKHLTLIYITMYYKNKDKPIIFFDSHSGQGLYDLNSPEASRSAEAYTGLFEIVGIMDKLSQEFKEILGSLNVNSEIRIYPGSPYIIKYLMRDIDRAIFVEKNPKVFEKLKVIKGNRVMLHNRCGYEAINALLPLEEKRGIILIDPPFESKMEFQKIIESILVLKKKFSNALIMIWYPIKNQELVSKFYNEIFDMNLNEIILEYSHDNSEKIGNLTKCGLMVINPVLGLEEFWTNLSRVLINYQFSIINKEEIN